MERRSFLKGLLGTAAVVAIPTTIVKATEKLPYLEKSLSSSNNVKEWERNINFLIKSFSDNIEYAWKRKDLSLLPTPTYESTVKKIEGMITYTQKEDNFPLSTDSVDKAFISLIKYELLIGNYTMSRNKLNMWKYVYNTPKDEFMQFNNDNERIQLFTKFNKTYRSLAKEVNLEHRIKNLKII